MAEGGSGQVEPDEEIVSRVLAGDRNAYGILVERHWRKAVLVALSRVGRIPEAEEITQEGFVVAYVKLATLRDGGRFPAWLSKIVQQKCADRLRRRKREKEMFVSAEEIAVEHVPSANTGLTADEIRSVRRAVLELPEKLRKAILLRYVAGLSAPEIAEMLGKKPGTVRIWLHRAYGRLRRRLGAVIEEARQ